MNVIDITGLIAGGMWNYEEPFPSFRMRPLGRVPWVDSEVYAEVFEGMHSQTGTYLETPAHYFGNDNWYGVADIPVEKLVNRRCIVLQLDGEAFESGERRIPIDAAMLEQCAGSGQIREGDAILVGTGWGRRWMDPVFLERSPYFTYGAMKWLIGKKPFLLGSDVPRWDNLAKSEQFFREFYEADILMLAPCVNLELVTASEVRLTALPLRIPGTSAVPCRAIVVEGDVHGN
ncbi:cyclase family protein [Paenibacillus ginsengarvi]|uniref:Cyclase family protein n=1 Tax=Paenibacillus ginsengarvi TaxID=400777 RepID=A0A3B0BR59_9BACL|nr:cyclase family protein [Paenibacillus ginsengarvi]RKN74186.1 cyclase family protein [Paenibacillus ginsengarvi]